MNGNDCTRGASDKTKATWYSSFMATKDEQKLWMRIGAAKEKLKKAKRPHHDRCMSEMDPDGVCTCGASQANAAIDNAIRALDPDSED